MLTLILGHTSFCVPYVLMMVRARLAGMDRATEEAARDLGAGPLRTFWDRDPARHSAGHFVRRAAVLCHVV